MKIALSGTHGIGKTSLAHSLVGALKERGVHATINPELIRSCPIPTGTEDTHSIESSFWVHGKQFIDEIELEKKYPVIVCDRSMLCNYAYFLWALKKNPQYKESPGAKIIHHLVDSWLPTYDFIFKLPISNQTKLSDDGFRSTAEGWQKEIDDFVDQIIKEKGIKVYTIPLESNEKRTQKIIDIIKTKIPELQ